MTKVQKFNVWAIGYWKLKFVCNLVLVIWDLMFTYYGILCNLTIIYDTIFQEPPLSPSSRHTRAPGREHEGLPHRYLQEFSHR